MSDYHHMLEPKKFKDSNGVVIKAGDILIRRFFIRQHEHPGRKRVAVNGMSGNDVIVRDEGALKARTPHWIAYDVRWAGACLTAERRDCSDFQAIMMGVAFDARGKELSVTGATYYFNEAFNSKQYTVVPDYPHSTNHKEQA